MGRQIKLGDWFRELGGDPLPLWAVPDVMRVEPTEVRRAVLRGELPVHTFRAPSGRVIRVVRQVDAKRCFGNLLVGKDVAAIAGRVVRQWMREAA